MTKTGASNSQYRERWLERILAQVPPGYKILDAGAGELAYKKFCGHLEYVSQDFAQYDGQGDNEGLQTNKWDGKNVDIVSDIAKIPVEDSSFDAIMCVEVLEHISEPVKAIEEFFRILKPGGALILTAPFCSLTHFAPYYFASGYSKYWYQKVLSENGFNIKEINLNGNYFEYLAQEINRLSGVASRYSQMSFIDKLLARLFKPLILTLLGRFSNHDRGSAELLCYGLNVLAVKNK